MLLKSNNYDERLISANNFPYEFQKSKIHIPMRKAASSNAALGIDRLNDIDKKFNVKQNLLPNKFLERWSEDNFKSSNKFSHHDNRNIIQGFGEYFGQGYGRKQIESTFYKTDPSHLAHEPVDPQNYVTTNKYHFSGAHTLDIDKSHRRFPRSYSHRTNIIMETQDSDKQPDITSKVFKQIKEKFGHNSSEISFSRANKNFNSGLWKYSYKKDANVYPNIKIQQIRKSCIDLSKY